MKKALVAALVLSAFLAVGCTSIRPVAAGDSIGGSKVGELSANYLFGVFPLGGGDTSIEKAAERGGITKISTVNERVFYFPWIWMTRTTIVRGE